MEVLFAEYELIVAIGAKAKKLLVATFPNGRKEGDDRLCLLELGESR